MVGDPKQLPATVISQEAVKYNYGQSLFEVRSLLHCSADMDDGCCGCVASCEGRA
jgi:superfamily I DNA and/or RNA helicase